MPDLQPPVRWLRFLRWFCHPDYLEEIEGDALERFYEYAPTLSDRQARWRFRRDVLTLLRPNLIRPLGFKITPIMLKQHLKVSWRQIRRDKAYSALNVFGLAIGITIVLLTAYWIKTEFTFNRHFENYDHIGRVMQHRTFENEKATWSSSAHPLASTLRRDYAHLFDLVALSTWPEVSTFTYQDKQLEVEGLFTEPAGPEILSLSMLSGSRDQVNGPSDVLLSAKFAEQLFPKGNAQGQTLELLGQAVEVRGIYRNLPKKSSFHEIDYIASWELYAATDDWVQEMPNPWYSSAYQTLVTRDPQLDFAQISQQIEPVVLNNGAYDPKIKTFNPQAFVHPMSKWYLSSSFENGVNTGGRIDNIRRFGWISVLVLLLACINFINLTTARTERNALQVGVRKTLGSSRGLLLQQFYTSSLLLTGLAAIIGIALAFLCVPFFNQLMDTELNLWQAGWTFWLSTLAIVVILGFFIGTFPAWRLASLQMLPALRANIHQTANFKAHGRRMLVVVQFTIAISLIIGVLLVNRQMQLGQERELGYDLAGLVRLYIDDDKVQASLPTIQEELLRSGYFTDIGRSNAPVDEVWSTNLGFRWPGKDPEVTFAIPTSSVSVEFGSTVGWEIVKGRDFSPDLASDSSAFIINQAAVQQMGLADPIGTVVHWDDVPYAIIGVVEDLLTGSPYEPNRPHIYHLEEGGLGRNLHLRLADREVPAALAKLESTIQSVFPAYVLQHGFADERFAAKFGDEVKLQRLITTLSMVAILISCLGLLGLSAYMVERRQREIGIRKVLGATTGQLWQLLSKNFLLLVGTACIVALPIAYLLARQWLMQFTLQTSLHWSLFIVPGVVALTLALATISWQTVRAARANPVEVIR